MKNLFTSESVSEGHPDKVSDQISDAILDAMLTSDPASRVAVETLVTTGLAVVSGEVTTNAYVDVQEVVRGVIRDIGYTKASYRFDADSCGVLVAIHQQSADIAQGVDEGEQKAQGAGDQGMMFGYACRETENLMPLSIQLSHDLVRELAHIRKKTSLMPYLAPDSKSQVTIEYDENGSPKRVDTIVLSTQHDEDVTQEQIRADIKKHLIGSVVPAEMMDSHTILHVNPTGKFVIGGPHGDTGLTGRKIIVDTYGGHGAHGGGAFSGKDATKVDRSAAYAARHIAKNLVAAGVCNEVLVQISYAIGVAEPTSIFVNTYGSANVNLNDSQIAETIKTNLSFTPYAVETRLKLRNPIYSETAAYGHMGREPKTLVKVFESPYNGKVAREVELFTWEKLDLVDQFKNLFNV